MNNQLVVIDDDNSDATIDVDEIEIIDIQDKYLKHQKILKRPRVMDTIVIDDSSENEVTNIKSGPIDKQTHYYYDFIFKENKLLSEFIEKCLDLENSSGMLRAINKTLLKIYNKTDENYKKSPNFTKVLLKSLKSLELKPEFKFSHVKELCEILKCHNVRRKVPFVTLQTNVRHNKMQNKPYKVMKKRKIDLDDSEQDNTVIDLDDDEVILLDDKIVSENSNKKNNIVHTNDPDVIIDNESDETREDVSNGINPEMENQTIGTENNSKTGIENENENENLDQLLVPLLNQDIHDPSTNVNKEKIKKIENVIAKYKKKIKQLDLEEVQDDTISSPYIQSEKLKAKIVALYEELCNITGSEATKHRNVRLQVADGHSVEPMRCLEEFINFNIGDDGEPMFPDFQDVKHCVQKANAKYKLGWTVGQVLKEAQALFIQYGTALQKWRQQREWRDLMSHINEETDIDPADNDPDLLAQLEENKHIALKNEQDLLDRYANIERKSKENTSNPELRLELSGLNSSDEYSENEEITPDRPNTESYLSSLNNKVCDSININSTINSVVSDCHTNAPVTKVNSNITNQSLQLKSPDTQDKVSILALQELKIHPVTNEQKKGDSFHDQNCVHGEVVSKVIKTKPNDHNESLEIAGHVDKHNLIQKDFYQDRPQPEIKKEHTVTEDNSNNIDGVKIKTELEDIPAILEQFGSNFTATVIDIEDPFLVIEISSDSDSEDDAYT